jgi:N-acetylglucosamine kinase-like BadF-type ATPase
MRLSAGGRIVAEVEGRGANVATLSPAIVKRRLTEVVAQFGSTPLHPVACCAGAAGAEVPAARARLEQLLASLLPGSRISVVHDARLILAAERIDEGIAIIAGTGSVAYGRTALGLEARAGGWGWRLGDEGGGAWITREAAREVLRRADAREPLGALGERLLALCGAPDTLQLMGKLNSLDEPMEWASRAQAVFDTEGADNGAHYIVLKAASALGDLVGSVRSALLIDGPVVLAGGLLLNLPSLESALRERLGAKCIRLKESPVAGAVRLAELELDT